MAAKIELREKWRDFDVELAGKRVGMLRFLSYEGNGHCESYACVPENLRTEEEDVRYEPKLGAFFLDWGNSASEGVRRIFRRHGMHISRREAIDATRRIKAPIK